MGTSLANIDMSKYMASSTAPTNPTSTNTRETTAPSTIENVDFSGSSSSTNTSADDYIKTHGDVNGDGKIDINDVAGIQKSLAGNGTIAEGMGDINGDGVVTVKDSTILQKYISGEQISNSLVGGNNSNASNSTSYSQEEPTTDPNTVDSYTLYSQSKQKEDERLSSQRQDTNSDGIYNTTDLVTIEEDIIGKKGNYTEDDLNAVKQKVLDANGDGKVDINDVTAIQKSLVENGEIVEGTGDINGDGRVTVKDVAIFQQYLSGKPLISILHGIAVPTVENTTYADLSLYDTIMTEPTNVMNAIRADYKDENPEFKYENIDYKDGMTHIKPMNNGKPMKMSDFNGYKGVDGDCEIVEYIYDEETGFDSIITKDANGNLKVSYGFTQDSQQGDIFADIVEGVSDRVPNLTFHHPQIIQAQKVADQAYQMSHNSGPGGGQAYVNFSGYSLGGCDAEAAVIYLNKKYSDAQYVIGSVSLVNPLHISDMSDEDVEILTTKNQNFKYYAQEMDVVHTLNSFDKMKKYQITLPPVTKGKYAWTNSKSTSSNKLSVYEATTNYGHCIDYFDKEGDYYKENFDEDGNLKNVSNNLYDTDEILKKYYGFGLEDFNPLMKNEIDYWLFDDSENHQGILPNAPEFVQDYAYLLSDAVTPVVTSTYQFFTTDWKDPSSVNHYIHQTGAQLITGPGDYATDVAAMWLDAIGLSELGDGVQEINNFFHRATYDIIDYGEKIVDGFLSLLPPW